MFKIQLFFFTLAMWGAGNLNKMVSSTLEPVLKNSKFLATGDKISLVDVYVYAYVRV